MQPYKITRKDGKVYYSRADYYWQLEHKSVEKIEHAEENYYVKAACIFYMGIEWSDKWYQDDLNERIITRIINRECLMHAISLETNSRCGCANCRPWTGEVRSVPEYSNLDHGIQQS